jgi:cytochrome b involved in lipid metabolism
VLFFGFSLRNPFHSDDFPLTPLIGPIAYLLYSGPGLVSVYIIFTAGEMLKFGVSKDGLVVMSLQAVRAALMAYAFQHHTLHFFVYYAAFSALNLHFSLIALYVPMTHPERDSRVTGLKRDLEMRFGAHYPTYTPPFPIWVHQWLFLGLTLHIEHHSFPQTPWYNLPLVHRDILKVTSSAERYPEPSVSSEQELRTRIELATPGRVISPRELAQHRSKESCWMAISGVVYDLTAWHEKHPGGAALIVAKSGRDMTESYIKQHTNLVNLSVNLERGISIVGVLESANALPSASDGLGRPQLSCTGVEYSAAHDPCAVPGRALRAQCAISFFILSSVVRFQRRLQMVP